MNQIINIFVLLATSSSVELSGKPERAPVTSLFIKQAHEPNQIFTKMLIHTDLLINYCLKYVSNLDVQVQL